MTTNLGELEQAIMEVLWEKKQGTVREVLYALNTNGRSLAYTTVMTVMARLSEKKLLSREELPNGTYFYKLFKTKEEYTCEASRKIVFDLIKNFGSVAVAQFVDVLEEVDPKEVKRLKEHLSKSKKAALV